MGCSSEAKRFTRPRSRRPRFNARHWRPIRRFISSLPERRERRSSRNLSDSATIQIRADTPRIEYKMGRTAALDGFVPLIVQKTISVAAVRTKVVAVPRCK